MHRVTLLGISAVLLWPSISYLTGAEIVAIPTVPYRHDGQAQYALSEVKRIVVDSEHASAVDNKGSTLIPPTLLQFATTFSGDLSSALGINVSVETGSSGPTSSIFLTLGDTKDYLDVAGRETSEGYSLTVGATGITVTGASPLGAWWGTRTILQQAILHNGSIPLGSSVDSPGWATRGMMLDVGRHFYPKEFLVEMCSYMSFFKQNTFHLHLSDNLFTFPFTRERALQVYARFRLWSDDEAVAGLNKHKNESFTRQEFDYIQTECAARGVTILPEIEAPGHALVIVQWKPQLGSLYEVSNLDLTHPETIPALKTIWKTFLPWFQCKVVSIGADEYAGDVTDYNRFVNAMASFIGETSGKYIRIWGSFIPNKSIGFTNIYQNISIQHWALFEGHPYAHWIKNNYSVLNSMDSFYIVNKFSGSYPQSIDLRKIFVGSPGGGPWYPHVFEASYEEINAPRNDPFVLGAITPLWNDYGPRSSVYSEAYYSWREAIPALADKQWGGNLTERDFGRVLSALHPRIPGQNLERAIPSKSTTIFDYDFDGLDASLASSSKQLTDKSSNGYHAKTDCSVENSTVAIKSGCAVITPLNSKGRNYTLSLSLMITSLDSPTNATLIYGKDSALMLTPAVTLFASGNYYNLKSTLPLNEWIELNISGVGKRTFASISRPGGSASIEEFFTRIELEGVYSQNAEMAIEAPLRQVGGPECGWTGRLRSLHLSSQGLRLPAGQG